VPYGSVPTQRHNIEGRVVRRAWADPAYRERLLDNPKAALAELLGVELPDSLEVRLVVERSDLLYIVLPVDVSPIPPETVRVMTGRRPPRGRVY